MAHEPKVNDDRELRSRFIEKISDVISIPEVEDKIINPKEIWERDVD